MSAVEAHLHEIRLGFAHEGKIVFMRIVRPMSDHGLNRQRPVGGRLAAQEQQGEQEQKRFHHRRVVIPRS